MHTTARVFLSRPGKDRRRAARKSLSKPLFRVARASAALTASSTNPARARPFGKLTSQSSNS
jgi:hypothetical protein